MTFSTIKSHFFGYVNALTEHRCAESPCSHTTFNASSIFQFSIDSNPCEGLNYSRKYICEIIFTGCNVQYVKLSFPQIAAACHYLPNKNVYPINLSNEEFSLPGRVEELRIYQATLNTLLNDAYDKGSPTRYSR